MVATLARAWAHVLTANIFARHPPQDERNSNLRPPSGDGSYYGCVSSAVFTMAASTSIVETIPQMQF